MAVHAEDALGGPGIPQVFDLALAVSTAKASGAEGLIPRKDRKVLDLVSTGAATVGTVVANERAIAEQQKVRVGIEEGAASVAAKAIEMPSVTGW